MTDVVWLLWNRALADYAKAATIWLLARMHRDYKEKQPPSGQPEPDGPK